MSKKAFFDRGDEMSVQKKIGDEKIGERTLLKFLGRSIYSRALCVIVRLYI